MISRYFPLAILIAFLTAAPIISGDVLIQARCGLGDSYAKEGYWAPVDLTVNFMPRDSSSVIDGEIVLLLGEYVPTRYIQPFRMGQGRKAISFNIIPSNDHLTNDGYTFRIQVRSRTRGTVFDEKFVVPATSMLLDNHTSLIIGVGADSLFGTELGGLLPIIRKGQSQRQVVTSWIEPARMPLALKGLDSADVLVWHDPKPTALEAPQLAAISDFVRCGGHLVLIASPDTVMTAFGDIPLPAHFGGTARLSLRRGTKPAALAELMYPKPDEMPVLNTNATIQINRMQLTERKASSSSHSLLVRRNFGRGRISMMALPLNDRFFQLYPRFRAEIFSHLVDLPTHKKQVEFCRKLSPRKSGSQQQPWLDHDQYSARGPAEVANSFVTCASELKPLAVWQIILFLMLFFFLSGPISYLVLKRKNRLEWTYPAFGIVSISFLIISYAGAYAIKGNRSFVRDVTFLDLHRNGKAQQTVYYGLFSSRPGMIRLNAASGIFVSGQGESEARAASGPYRNQTPSLIPVAGNDLVVSTPAFTAPAAVMLRQWQIQQFAQVESVETVFGLTLRKPENGRSEGGIAVNTGRVGFSKVFLVTANHVWETGQLGSGEESVLRQKTSLTSVLTKAIENNRYSVSRREVETLERHDIVSASFPLLVEAYLKGTVRRVGEHGTRIADINDELDGLLAELLSKENKPQLSRWQTLCSVAPADDYQHLDMTRILCEGGSVLIGLSNQPGSRIDTGKTNAIRTSQTIVRVICDGPQE